MVRRFFLLKICEIYMKSMLEIKIKLLPAVSFVSSLRPKDFQVRGISGERKFLSYLVKTLRICAHKWYNTAANRIVRFHALGMTMSTVERRSQDRALLRISRFWYAVGAYHHVRSAHYVSFVRCHERHLRMAGIINPFSAGWVSHRSYVPYVMGCAQGRP